MLALLHFEQAPGRYPIARREPRPLFDHVGSVMLLAAGRPVEGLPAAPALEPQLRRAARYFIRTVMLRPGADAYTLLGLRPGFEPAQLREHYRQMIRLTHPDQDLAGEIWPRDAAVRINLARQALSSPQPPSPTAALRPGMPSVRPALAVRALPRPRLRRNALARPEPRPGPPGWTARVRLALAGMGAALAAGAILLRGPRSPAEAAREHSAPAPRAKQEELKP